MSLESVQARIEQLGKNFVGLVQEVRGLQEQQTAHDAGPEPETWRVTAYGLKEPRTFAGELLPFAFCAGHGWPRAEGIGDENRPVATHPVTDSGLARMRQLDGRLLVIKDVKPIDQKPSTQPAAQQQQQRK